MGDAQHSLLSPSAARRWMHCPPSALACATAGDGGSDFAAEGTVAHALCALRLKRSLGRDVSAELAVLATAAAAQWRDGAMDTAAEEYTYIVMRRYAEALRRYPKAVLLVEHRLDIALPIPTFGTADALIIADGGIDVIDFKYGRGVQVSAMDNEQLMLYAVGALDAAAAMGFGAVPEVTMIIEQPRLMNSSMCTMTAAYLRAWFEGQARPLAELAAHGLGYRHPGAWCRFCKAAAECGALGAFAAEAAGVDTPEGIADALGKAETVEIWLRAVRAKAVDVLGSGGTLPGYKLVRNRGRRTVGDAAGMRRALKLAGYTAAQVTKVDELKSLTELEALMGAKRFAEVCSDFITYRQGSLTVAADTDSRPAASSGDDFDGFMNDNDNQ